MEVKQASTVDPPARALMCSHTLLKISEIIAPNWSLKRRMLQAEVFSWAGWKAPNCQKSREESVRHEIETSQCGDSSVGSVW